MAFKNALFVLSVMTPALLAGCSGTAPSAHTNPVLGAEQGFQSGPTDRGTVRPVEGFHSEPMIGAPTIPVDIPTDIAPKKRPDRSGMPRLSGYSLRQITDALNNHGEGERISWYENRAQYQMRIDTHAYERDKRYCKDVMILHKHNTIHSPWQRHFVTFCRVTPQAPWKLQY